jgi:hypothetical protein
MSILLRCKRLKIASFFGSYFGSWVKMVFVGCSRRQQIKTLMRAHVPGMQRHEDDINGSCSGTQLGVDVMCHGGTWLSMQPGYISPW